MDRRGRRKRGRPSVDAYPADGDAAGQFPKLKRTGKVSGTREFSVTGLPYVIIYAITDDAVDVLTVMHTRRRYPL